MPTLRFQPRLALLDLELRRLWREPWLPYASLMLLPLLFTFLFSSARTSSAPGADLFGVLVWWWCLAAHVALLPLTGLAFRGEYQRDELEALQVAGFSSLSLCAGLLGSRLVTALAVLLIPMPMVVLCYLLGGLSGAGLQAACLHLPAHFLFTATTYAFLGIALPTTAGYWGLALVFAFLQLFPMVPSPLLAGAAHTVALAMGGRSMAGQDPVQWQLGCAAVLGMASVLGLGIRLRRGNLAGEVSNTRHPWMNPGERPSEKEPIRWKERWLGLGGLPARWVRLGWGPAAVGLFVLLPSLFARKGWADASTLMLGYGLVFGSGLVLSVAHGILSAHRLFAREQAGQTLDDLALARGEIFGVIHEKLREYRASSLQIWQSCLGGMVLGWVFLMGTQDHDLSGFLVVALLVMPIAGFLIFRFQECFVLDLCRQWSNPDGLPATALVREGSRFVALFVVFLFLIPISLVLTVVTQLLAFITLPLMIRFWFRYFRKSLTLKQRLLFVEICPRYDGPEYIEALDRQYPSTPVRKTSSLLYPGLPPAESK